MFFLWNGIHNTIKICMSIKKGTFISHKKCALKNSKQQTKVKQTNKKKIVNNKKKFIDVIEFVQLLMLLRSLSYDNFASLDFVSFDFHKSFAVENEASENDVGVVKSEEKSDASIAVNVKNVAHVANYINDWCSEVNFDVN